MNCGANTAEVEDMAKKEYEYDNSFLVEEFNYCLYGEACDEYGFIDDIVTGVCNLDLGGNTRPLSRNFIWTLISNQPVVKTSLVMEATGKSKSHSQKLVAVVRIACRAIEKEIKKLDSAGVKTHKINLEGS